MSDLISRQDAIEAIWKIKDERDSIYYTSAIHSSIDAIEQLPSAERTGHWLMLTPQSAKCSECGNIQVTHGKDMTMKCVIFYAIYRYCPNCGARMEIEYE